MNSSKFQSYFWLIAGLLLFVTVYYFFSLAVYVAVATVIMLVSDPMVNKLSNFKLFKYSIQLPRYLSALIVLSLIVAFLSIILIAFIPIINKQIYSLRHIELNYLKENFYSYLYKLEQYYKSIYPNESKSILELIQEKIITFFNPKNIADTIGSTLVFTGNIFIAFFSIIFITFFMIKDKELLKQKIFLFVPEKEKNSVNNILKKCKETLSRYFIGLLVQVSGIFFCNFLGLSLMNVQNALSIATISAILNIIPYIGPLMGMIFAFFIVTATYLNYDTSIAIIYVKTFIIMLGTQLIDNFVFQPLIFSKSIKAHPLEIFLVVIAAGTLYGILGMLLAIPVYSVIRITLKQILEDSKLEKLS